MIDENWTQAFAWIDYFDLRLPCQRGSFTRAKPIKPGAKLFRQMQLFLKILNDVLEFRQIFRDRLDQGLVSFQHRLAPSGLLLAVLEELPRPFLRRSRVR